MIGAFATSGKRFPPAGRRVRKRQTIGAAVRHFPGEGKAINLSASESLASRESARSARESRPNHRADPVPRSTPPHTDGSARMALGPFDTHEVKNQPPSLAGRNLFDADPVLGGTLEGTVDDETAADLLRLGGYWGSAEAHELARLAEGHPPVLRTHDHRGNRLDVVEYHPAYFAIMRRTIEHGLASSLWESAIIDVGARHLARAVRLYLAAQGECGHLAAISSTSAALAALAVAPDLEAVWRPAVCTRRYDHRFIPAPSKLGVTIGVAATEIQAGSDLDGVTTRAEPADAGGYRLIGHKWFLSSPMADAFLTLAHTPAGPSLFLMPRFRGDGTTNAIRLVRLKGKLGNRVNATAEAELTGAEARLVGTPGTGLALLARSTAMMRLDRAAISAGIMRAAFAEAVHHARHRVAFGKTLIDQALMQRVLADMALDVAAATALVARVAHAWDNAATDPAEAAYARLMTPIAKYWVTKITPMLVAEAMECVGGASYVEEGPLARLYREAPANMLADGLGNVLCLDALAEVEAHEGTLGLVLGEIERDLGRAFAVSFSDLADAAAALASDPGSARVVAEQLALAAAAGALRRWTPRLLSDAFVDSRIAGPWRATYGMLEARFDPRGIIDYAAP